MSEKSREKEGGVKSGSEPKGYLPSATAKRPKDMTPDEVRYWFVHFHVTSC